MIWRSLAGELVPEPGVIAARASEFVTRAGSFLMDGPSILSRILYYTPLNERDEQKLIEQFVSVTRATVEGSVLVGLIQGGLAGAAFFALSLPGAAFWAPSSPTRGGNPIYMGEGLPPQWREYSEETARRVDEGVEEIINSCYQRALATLKRHRADLDRMAARPQESEELPVEEDDVLIGDTQSEAS